MREGQPSEWWEAVVHCLQFQMRCVLLCHSQVELKAPLEHFNVVGSSTKEVSACHPDGWCMPPICCFQQLQEAQMEYFVSFISGIKSSITDWAASFLPSPLFSKGKKRIQPSGSNCDDEVTSGLGGIKHGGLGPLLHSV